MFVGAVITSHMLSGASPSDTTLLPVIESRDTRAVSQTASCLGLVPHTHSLFILLSFNFFLLSSRIHADFTDSLKGDFFQ